MTDNDKKTAPRIVILGAGFGGVYALKRLRKLFRGDPNASLALVNNKNYFLFTPFLHEIATGGISPENIVEPIREVFRCCLSDFYLAEVRRVSLRKKTVYTSIGAINYDYLVLAMGADTNYYGIAGAEENSFALKNMDDAVRLKNNFIEKFERASKTADPEKLEKLLTFVVVGGGPTGVELSAEMAELFFGTFAKYYPGWLMAKVKIILLQRSDELLPRFAERLRKRSLDVLKTKRIDVRLGISASKVGKDFIEINGGEVIPTSTVIWVAGVKPREMNFDEPVKKDNAGRLIVDQTLQLADYPEVFALGDMASFEVGGEALPALAQVAVREASRVAVNIRNMVQKKKPGPFSYKHRGDLVSLGRWMAAAEIGRFTFFGHFAWWLWRTVYLFKLLSFSRKIKVAMDWTIDIFAPRDISEL